MFPGYNDSVKKIAKKIFFIIRAGSEIPALLPFFEYIFAKYIAWSSFLWTMQCFLL